MGGRDRTGPIALLLLAAVDVAPTEIVDDYLETSGVATIERRPRTATTTRQKSGRSADDTEPR